MYCLTVKKTISVMKLIILLGFFLGCSFVVHSENLDSILQVLDTCVINKNIYEKNLIRKIDSLQNILNKNSDDSIQLETWIKIMKLESCHDVHKAISATNQALHLAHKRSDHNKIFFILLNKVELLENLGLPQEGENILDSLLLHGNISKDQRLQVMIDKYNLYDFYRVHELPGEITDKKLASLRPISEMITQYTSELTQAITMQYNTYDIKASIQILKQEYEVALENDKAVLATVISNKYFLLKDLNNRDYWWAVSAIHALKNVQYEYEALIRLSARMIEINQFDRAEKYSLAAFDNAQIFNSRIRKSEIAPVLAKCLTLKKKEYMASQENNKKWIICTIILGTSSLLLLGLVLIFYRKNIQNARAFSKIKNEDKRIILSLQNEKEIKNEYLAHLLELSLDAILKFEQFRNHVLIKIKSGEGEKLKKQLSSSNQFSDFQKDCLRRFELAFFRLYPDFTQEVNQLLKPEERIKLSDKELFNNELRVLALLKLGITDASRIATILGIAVRTVYFYRNRMKNKALNKETFEKDLFKNDR